MSVTVTPVSRVAATPADAAEDFAAWSSRLAAQAELALEKCLPSSEIRLTQLHEAMRYAVLGGGKRVRPLLVYAAGELAGAPGAALDCAACAVELIHAYSLVHDDMPCMDNDALRRGKPTVHVAFGEALAMLVGDALQARAFEVLAQAHAHGAGASATIQMSVELARAAGSIGMAGGQAIDLASVGMRLDRATLEDMHRRKTGAMLTASVRLGALAGTVLTPDQQQALERYAQAIGLAFQVVDDILDVEGDSATLGKSAGKDALNDKPTYVSVIGLPASRELADSLRTQAFAACDELGLAALRLRQIAQLIVDRKS